jgi:hypothetical protein
LRVLHRQLVPRHSSHTLISFTNSQLYRMLDAFLFKSRYATVKELCAGSTFRSARTPRLACARRGERSESYTKGSRFCYPPWDFWWIARLGPLRAPRRASSLLPLGLPTPVRRSPFGGLPQFSAWPLSVCRGRRPCGPDLPCLRHLVGRRSTAGDIPSVPYGPTADDPRPRHVELAMDPGRTDRRAGLRPLPGGCP